MAISVQQVIDGLYIAFYNRSADQPGYNYWENTVGLSQAGANSTFVVDGNYQYAAPLGSAFYSTQSTYFNATYSALNSSDFVNKIYVNFGGNAADATGLAYWVAKLTAGQSKQMVAYQIAQDFLTINLANQGLSASDLALATIRQQTFDNKVTVSEFYAAASATHSFLVAQTASTTDQAFNAEIAIEANVTSTAASVTAAENLITAAVAAGNVTPIINGTGTVTPPAPSTFTLTLGTDMVGGSGNGGDTIVAPILFNAGTGTQITTLQAGDTITETGTGNQLSLSIGASDKTIVGATISGVQTFNITNTGFAATAANPVIQGSGITGLTTVNNVNSSNNVFVGSAATPLAAVLTNVGVSSTSSSPNLTNTSVFIATAALAGAADALTVNANNAGSMTVADFVLAGAATGTNGYEIITVAASGVDFVGIGNPLAGVNTTTTVKVTGAGSLSLFGDGTAGDFAKLATIDASAATGPVTITGSATGMPAPGILTGDTAIKSVLGGAGSDLVDISSLSLAQFTGNTTTVDLGGGTNTLVVSDSIATTTNALTGIANVQILGDANPGSTAAGIIDFSKLPSSIIDFKLFANEKNNLTLINAPGSFTFDESTFGGLTTSITAAGTGTADTLTIIEGSATAGNIALEVYNVTGYETINVTANGPAGALDHLEQIKATASAGGNETVNIGGAENLLIEAPAAGSAIELHGAMTAIKITDTGVVTLATNVNTGSTNAQTIDASASGGLIQGGAETGNNGTAGQTILGSTGHGNILIGSLGGDSITGGSANDVIVTDGGADTINLAATHLASAVEIYGVNNGTTVQTLGAVQGAGAGSIVDVHDDAAAGFWGVAPGTAQSAATNIFTLFPGTGTTAATFGTSADQAIVSNFKVGATGDTIDISVKSFAAAGAPAHDGLVAVNLNNAPGLGDSVPTFVSAGGTLSGSTSDLVVINPGPGATFANAGVLAQALKSGTFSLSFGTAPLAAGNIDHVLFAYSDGTNAHIADVAIQEAGGSAQLANQQHIAASDLVQLTGVSVASLVGHNVHIVA